ncbi:MAG TPA: biotin/lipoyl-containing protein [Candidatus Limnocylindrales bacterium]|nr:biotin/lipoyl-containing protein [Candidatus Limnocylindrales bacterium]
MTDEGSAVAGVGSLRVRTAPASARPGDEPLTLGPDSGHRLEPAGPGRALLLEAGGGQTSQPARTPVLLGALRRPRASGPRLVEVVVDGWRFEVEVEPESRAALRERGSRDRRVGTHGGAAELRAIIPGRVVAVSVAPGDPVSAGQQLLVVEAMKMQNEVRAPIAGVVERLAVAEGQTIELGDILAVIGQDQ